MVTEVLDITYIHADEKQSIKLDKHSENFDENLRKVEQFLADSQVIDIEYRHTVDELELDVESSEEIK